MLHALAAALALGGVMTIGDWTWAALHVRHTVAAGLAHGASLCLGAAIGIREGRWLAGAAAGPAIGVLAAGLFYLLTPSLRMSAMFPAWMFFWVCFALLQAWLRGHRHYGSGIAAGLFAAVLSGAAFYTISGIWTRHDPEGPSYAWNFLAWSFAFLPGFAVLFWRRPGDERRRSPVGTTA
jgi:hypothetical protein